MSSRDSAVTRIAILDAARNLFESQGYFSVGLDTVAKQAEVSRQAIYLHFESKPDLLRALHERINAQHVAPAFQKVWEAKNAGAALDAWVEASAEAIPNIIGIFHALETPSHVDPDAQPTWRAPVEGHYGDCRRLAQWLRRDGDLAPGTSVGEAADIIWSTTSVRAYESLVIARRWPRQRWIRWLKKTLRQLLTDTPTALDRTS